MEERVNRSLWIAVIALIALPVASHAQEAYAPLIKIPEGNENDPEMQMGIMMLENSTVPDRSAVSQPPYPGAQVLQALDTNPMFDDDDFEPLPFIRLLTTDEATKVVNFYREQLSDWTYKEWFGVHIICEGDGEFELMEESGETTPSVTVSEVESGFYKVMPDAKTEITIRYRGQ
jgi:hypothetical protein